MTQAPRSRAEEIADVLRDEILGGQYRAGERLPSERDLAARFESNRGAVRESLKKLEQMGIANIQPGGARVVPVEEASLDVLGHLVDLEDVPNPALVAQLLEVLGALMSMSGRTAVDLASPEDLERLSCHVRDMQQHLSEDGADEKLAQDWRELGLMFTAINRNLVLRLILNGLKTQFVSRMTGRRAPEPIDHSWAPGILQQLEGGLAGGDAGAVADAISQHFRQLQRSFAEAIAQAEERSYSHG